MTAQTEHVAYLDDPLIVLARASWLLRWANRLTRVAPKMKAEDQRQECLGMIEVFLDRADDLIRQAISCIGTSSSR
jgi:hypothetical protein